MRETRRVNKVKYRKSEQRDRIKKKESKMIINQDSRHQRRDDAPQHQHQLDNHSPYSIPYPLPNASAGLTLTFTLAPSTERPPPYNPRSRSYPNPGPPNPLPLPNPLPSPYPTAHRLPRAAFHPTRQSLIFISPGFHSHGKSSVTPLSHSHPPRSCLQWSDCWVRGVEASDLLCKHLLWNCM